MGVTIHEARERIRAGAEYGSVYELLPEHERGALAEWFVREPGMPNLAARRAALPVPTGEMCLRCGGLMARTGTCMTCQGCGESSGGCG